MCLVSFYLFLKFLVVGVFSETLFTFILGIVVPSVCNAETVRREETSIGAAKTIGINHSAAFLDMSDSLIEDIEEGVSVLVNDEWPDNDACPDAIYSEMSGDIVRDSFFCQVTKCGFSFNGFLSIIVSHYDTSF
jgi:hypothetical protein